MGFGLGLICFVVALDKKRLWNRLFRLKGMGVSRDYVLLMEGELYSVAKAAVLRVLRRIQKLHKMI